MGNRKIGNENPQEHAFHIMNTKIEGNLIKTNVDIEYALISSIPVNVIPETRQIVLRNPNADIDIFGGFALFAGFGEEDKNLSEIELHAE